MGFRAGAGVAGETEGEIPATCIGPVIPMETLKQEDGGKSFTLKSLINCFGNVDFSRFPSPGMPHVKSG